MERIKRNSNKEKTEKGTYHPYTMWTQDAELIGMRQLFNQNYKQFYGTYSEGMRFYMNGNWKEAKNCFETTQQMIKGHDDGPSKAILANMKKIAEDGEAPKNWPGYRLTTDV